MSAIDSSPLTIYVEFCYLETVATGKTKTAIPDFAYSGTRYKDTLKTRERKIGQQNAFSSAHSDNWLVALPAKLHITAKAS